MPPGIASKLAGALGPVLAGSLVAVIFVFRCGDTLASTTPPVRAEISEVGQTETRAVKPTLEPTIAPPSAELATSSPLPSESTRSAPKPDPKLAASNNLPPTTAPTLAPSPAPIPTAPSTPSPVVTPSPIPTTAPTVNPTQSPTQQPTQSPTQQPTQAPTQQPTQAPTQQPTQQPTATPTSTPTQRATSSPTPKPNSPPQIERIGDQSGKVGQRFVIRVSASDMDGDKIALSCGGADKFTDNGDGTGTLDWTGTKPGKYAFSCSASDGQSSSSTAFAITVA